MAKRMSKEEKALEARVARLFREHCSNIEIPMLKLSQVSDLGRELAAQGLEDDEIGARMAELARSLK
jgi:hypothetical protein